MRVMSETVKELIEGSRYGESVSMVVWAGTGPKLPIPIMAEKVTISCDATRQVQNQITIEVIDPDGSLTPWQIDDPLGVGGSSLHLTWNFPGESMPFGRFPIVKADPGDMWRLTRVDRQLQGDPMGHIQLSRFESATKITLTCEDVTRRVVDNDLPSVQSPRKGTTYLAEIRRLLAPMCAVKVGPGVVDKAVSPLMILPEKRMDAVEDLIDGLGCLWRVNESGAVEIINPSSRVPVWKIQPALDGWTGSLIDVKHTQDVSDIVNAVYVTGSTESGAPLLARVFETTGPARSGGPIGVRTKTVQSNVAKTQAAVNAEANTWLSNELRERTTLLAVNVPGHPGIQVHDLVTIVQPVVNSRPVDITGTVVSTSLDITAGSVSPMTLTVSVPTSTIQALATALRGSSLTERQTMMGAIQ